MVLKAKILETKPEVKYTDVIYEQTVIIELPSGKKMGIFDYEMQVTSEMIGKTKDLLILAFIPKEVEKLTKTECRIVPYPKKSIDWKNHTYYGRIEKISSENRKKRIILDIGEGEIYVDFDVKKLIEGKLKEGDYLRVLALRTDLLGIC